MVTLEERELFLKAMSENWIGVPTKSEPEVQKSKPRRPAKDYDFKIDLHGLTADKALSRVKACLIRCSEIGRKRVLIIHGKGSGILRYEIRGFLAHCEWVSQVQEVPSKLGGDGAVLVLLRSTL